MFELCSKPIFDFISAYLMVNSLTDSTFPEEGYRFRSPILRRFGLVYFLKKDLIEKLLDSKIQKSQQLKQKD